MAEKLPAPPPTGASAIDQNRYIDFARQFGLDTYADRVDPSMGRPDLSQRALTGLEGASTEQNDNQLVFVGTKNGLNVYKNLGGGTLNGQQYYELGDDGSLKGVYNPRTGDGFVDQLMAFAAPPLATLQRMNKAASENDPYSFSHNAFTFSPMVDDGITNVGGVANEATDGALGQIVNIAGPTIGGIIGGVYGGPWGGVAGGMVGKQFAGRFNNLKERDIQQGTALTGAMGAATVGAGQYLGGLGGGFSGGTGELLSGAADSAVGGAGSGVANFATSVDPYLTAAAAGASNFTPQGEGSVAPTGTGDTIESLMQNTVENQGGLTPDMSVDPIPTDSAIEAIAPTNAPSPESSGMSLPDSFPDISASDVKSVLGNAYRAANTGMQVKKMVDLVQNLSRGRQNQPAPVQQIAQQPVIPTGVPSFSNVPRDIDRTAWGAVLV